MDKLPWAQILLSLAFFGLGLFELHSGYSAGKGSIVYRTGSPHTYWFEVGCAFIVAGIFAIAGLKSYLADRKLFKDDSDK